MQKVAEKKREPTSRIVRDTFPISQRRGSEQRWFEWTLVVDVN